MVYANCPLCIITIGGGFGIAKKLGLDPLLVAIWLSGLNSAIAFWLSSKLKQKILGNKYFLSLVFYFSSFFYLSISQQLTFRHAILGIDRTVFGLTVGLVAFFAAEYFEKIMRKKNNDVPFFPLQKILTPLFVLVLTTIFLSIIYP